MDFNGRHFSLTIYFFYVKINYKLKKNLSNEGGIELNLIPISNKYSINIEEYEKLKIDDELPTQRDLFRRICYPKSEKFTGTESRLLEIIGKYIVDYETIAGFNKIKIKSIQPTQKLIEIAESLPIQRIRYDANRDFLLDYIIFSLNYDGEDILYLSTTEIIKDADIFQNFYYEYAKIYYDRLYASKEDNEKLEDFVSTYDINDKHYFVNVMDKLGEILYNTVFSKDNILSWGEDNVAAVERVLYQNGKELDREDSMIIEETYIQPFKDQGVHPKSLIKLANGDYMRRKGLNPKQHKWFYYKYKFEKPNKQLFVCEEELTYHRTMLNSKIIQGLHKKVGEPKTPKIKDNLDYIISNIKI